MFLLETCFCDIDLDDIVPLFVVSWKHMKWRLVYSYNESIQDKTKQTNNVRSNIDKAEMLSCYMKEAWPKRLQAVWLYLYSGKTKTVEGREDQWLPGVNDEEGIWPEREAEGIFLRDDRIVLYFDRDGVTWQYAFAKCVKSQTKKTRFYFMSIKKNVENITQKID